MSKTFTPPQIEVVRSTQFHGPYIQETHTGRTVCDFYVLYRNANIGKETPIHFDNADQYATLFVAAPDLVDACKALIERVLKLTVTSQPEVQIARAALAKAGAL